MSGSLHSSLPRTMPCSMCPGVERVLEEQGTRLGYRCPCCRSILRTGEMIHAEGEQRAAEQGMTLDEYRESIGVKFRDWEAEPQTPAEAAQIAEFVRKRAADWTPVCEHDTNPWTTPVDEL